MQVSACFFVPLPHPHHIADAVLVQVLWDETDPSNPSNKLAERVLAHVAQWIVDESKKLPAEQAAAFAGALSWPCKVHFDAPQQSGVWDCGIFMLTNFALGGTGREFRFSQADIPTLRRRIMHDLLLNMLRSPPLLPELGSLWLPE